MPISPEELSIEASRRVVDNTEVEVAESELDDIEEDRKDLMESLETPKEHKERERAEGEADFERRKEEADKLLTRNAFGQQLHEYIDERKLQVAQNAPGSRWERFKFAINFGGERGQQYKLAKEELSKAERRLNVWQAQEAECILGAEVVIAEIRSYQEAMDDHTLSSKEERSFQRKIEKANAQVLAKRQMIETKLLPGIKELTGISAEIPIEETIEKIPTQKEIEDGLTERQRILSEIGVENEDRPDDYQRIVLEFLSKFDLRNEEDYKQALEGIRAIRDAAAQYVESGVIEDETRDNLINLLKVDKPSLELLKEDTAAAVKAMLPYIKEVLGSEGGKLDDEHLEAFLRGESAKSIARYVKEAQERVLLGQMLESVALDPRTFKSRELRGVLELMKINSRDLRASKLGVRIERKKAYMHQIVDKGRQEMEGHAKRVLAQIVEAEVQDVEEATFKKIIDEGENGFAATYQLLRTIGVGLSPKALGTLTSPIFSAESLALDAVTEVSKPFERIFGESENLVLWQSSLAERRGQSARRIEERKEVFLEAFFQLKKVAPIAFNKTVSKAFLSRLSSIRSS